jgi:hypothetical protein
MFHRITNDNCYHVHKVRGVECFQQPEVLVKAIESQVGVKLEHKFCCGFTVPKWYTKQAFRRTKAGKRLRRFWVNMKNSKMFRRK